MKYFANSLIMGLLVSSLFIFTPTLHAAGPDNIQQLFASPDEAIKAVQTATGNNDKASLKMIFGPEVEDLLTGDKVQDAHNGRRFATLISQGYVLEKQGDDKVVVEIGPNSWPMPVPLVKRNGQWYFDTIAGKDEILNRHIGKDELHAIGICRAYVTAQQQFASINPEAAKGIKYALKFKSTPGKKDGLYWISNQNELPSPFGSAVAEQRPFHGYFFKILTRQGKDAPGGKLNYLNQGDLTGGFALVAYPVRWGRSGIMTFIVNQDGKVYQRDFDKNTYRIARSMKVYNPDREWSLVGEQGILSAVSEQ